MSAETTNSSAKRDAETKGSTSVESGASGPEELRARSFTTLKNYVLSNDKPDSSLVKDIRGEYAFKAKMADDTLLYVSASAELDGATSKATGQVEGDEVHTAASANSDLRIGDATDSNAFKDAWNKAWGAGGRQEDDPFEIAQRVAFFGDGSGTSQDFVHGFGARVCDSTCPNSTWMPSKWIITKDLSSSSSGLDFTPGVWCGYTSPKTTCQPSSQPTLSLPA
jgi:hypothetical protein